jgi:hypothetical protein
MAIIALATGEHRSPGSLRQCHMDCLEIARLPRHHIALLRQFQPSDKRGGPSRPPPYFSPHLTFRNSSWGRVRQEPLERHHFRRRGETPHDARPGLGNLGELERARPIDRRRIRVGGSASLCVELGRCCKRGREAASGRMEKSAVLAPVPKQTVLTVEREGTGWTAKATGDCPILRRSFLRRTTTSAAFTPCS